MQMTEILSLNENQEMSRTPDSIGDTRIEIGRIVDIHPERGTVDYRSEMTERYSYDIPYVYPYFDQVGGSGYTFNPEVGTTAICLTTSEGRNVILGFIGVDEDGSYLCGREQGNPGDMFITGRDGNFLIIRRGGIVQIGSKPLCQTVYIPTNNIIQNYSENFELYTLAGEMKFSVAREEDQSDGHSKALYSLNVREFADDPKDNPIVNMQAGSQPENIIFSITTRDKGNGTIKVTIKIDKDGTLSMSLEKNLIVKIKGDTKIETSGKTDIKSTGDFTIDSSANLKLHGRTTSMKADTTGEVLANGVLTLRGAQTKLGPGPHRPVMVLNEQMSAFLAAVAAVVKMPVPTPSVTVLA